MLSDTRLSYAVLFYLVWKGLQGTCVYSLPGTMLMVRALWVRLQLPPYLLAYAGQRGLGDVVERHDLHAAE